MISDTTTSSIQPRHRFVFFAVLIGLACLLGYYLQSPMDANRLGKVELADLERTLSLKLPEEVVLVKGSDGGRYDPSQGYYLWLLFSEQQIELAPQNVPSPNNYLPNSDVLQMTEWIQSLTKNTITDGVKASSLAWMAGDFEFSGDLLKTAKGDYLCVQRFRKKSP